MYDLKWLAATMLSGLAIGAGPVIATTATVENDPARQAGEATATAPEQESARNETEAAKPRLPAASDTHRTGPTQRHDASGKVKQTPPTLSEDKKRKKNATNKTDAGIAGDTTR